MKDLRTYIECEGGGGAMPSNTLGAGNPSMIDGDWGTEPFMQGRIELNEPTAKTKQEDPNTSKTKKNKKKKHMKDLKEQLSESLLVESSKQYTVRYEVYDRMGGNLRTYKTTAEDLYDLLQQMANDLNMYLSDYHFDEAEDGPFALSEKDINNPKKREEKAQEILDNFFDYMGDGSDFIFWIKQGSKKIWDSGAGEDE